MNKNELLKKAKEENKGFDERELQQARMSSALAFFVGLFLCLLIRVTCYLVDGVDPLVSIACTLIYCGMIAADCIFKAVFVRKKYFIIGAIFFPVLFAAFLALFISMLINR